MRGRTLSEKYLNGPYRRFFDLAYAASSKSQRLDLWLPEKDGDGPFPLVIFFHGGAFRFGDKRGNQSTPVMRSLEKGYAVADVEYRKSGEKIFPSMLYDAKAAVRYLKSIAGEYNLDTGRFLAWGPSSGGWLVSMLALTDGLPAFEDLTMGHGECSSSVCAVVDWCGPCGNFYLMDSDFEKGTAVNEHPHSGPDTPESLFLGTVVSEAEDLCRLTCPCSYARADAVPFIIIHGDKDGTVPMQQSERLYNALVSAGAEDVQLRILPGVPHHGPFWNDNEAIADITYEFIDRIFAK